MGIISSISVPLFLKNIIDSLTTPTSAYLFVILIGYGVIWTFSQVSVELRPFLSYKIEQRITRILGQRALIHLFGCSYSHFIDQKPGALMNIIRRAQRDIPSLRDPDSGSPVLA